METKELKIQIPDGYIIDREKSTFEKIVFKEADSKPRSWEEYCEKYPIGNNEYYIHGSDGSIRKRAPMKREVWADTAVLPSEELAEAFLALMQLMSLRQAWIGDWEPDWDKDETKYCITICDNKYIVSDFLGHHHTLSFPTEEMAIDFVKCFKNLLNAANPLI